jgi:hypothetical protein
MKVFVNSIVLQMELSLGRTVSTIFNYNKNLLKKEKIPIHKYYGILRLVSKECSSYDIIIEEMKKIRANVNYSIYKVPKFIVPTLKEVEERYAHISIK